MILRSPKSTPYGPTLSLHSARPSLLVRSPYFVRFGMRWLSLDSIGVPAQCFQAGCCHAAEAVAGHFVLAVAKPAQGKVHGVLAHWSATPAKGREYQRAAASQWVKVAQYLDRLHRQRDKVRRPHLHSVAQIGRAHV